MTRPSDLDAEIRAAVDERRAVLVAGTGVSLAASVDPATGEPHPQASWAGLLESGLAWLEERGLIAPARAQAHRSLLDGDATTYNYVSAAQDIVTAMGGPDSIHFEKWLANTVGKIVARDRAVLDALADLRGHGNLLATTNYDELLLGAADAPDPVTWADEDGAFLAAVRNRRKDAVLFLHGWWQKPESVVLDWKSYDRIVRDQQHREDLAAVWSTTTWVYVGCGVNGLDDPDLGLLLERYGKRARSAGMFDYCLVRDDQLREFQARFDRQGHNIKAIGFGAEHGDLAPYLRSLLPPPQPPGDGPAGVSTATTAPAGPKIPSPPTLYAQPEYLGSHAFVGRTSQLQDLDEWALQADPTNLLLYEAMGGMGKSMLTWEWVTTRAPAVRSDWAGRCWYSFYERGARMADFCRHALAYMTGESPRTFDTVSSVDLADRLIAELQERPWLLVLDGLERLLVAYHRIDAAEIPDEQADTPTDQLLESRSPTATIRDEDGDLLRRLAAAHPSKILVTSRLVPQVLLNPARQPIPGAKHLPLSGLRPEDAEALARAAGIEGDGARLRAYLTENCDNHPLVVGVLAGLIANYQPDRGNFDTWANDPGPRGGARLNLATLDLIQRRNHILRAALDDLPDPSRHLLSTLALISEAVDYDTLAAFNPHLPPPPDHITEPRPPEQHRLWEHWGEEYQARLRDEYETKRARWNNYQRELAAWQGSDEVREAPQQLDATITDLEERGMLQYDHDTRRYDLHPVVRAVTVGDLRDDDRDRYGQQVVDHFSSVTHQPYSQATTLDDLAPALHVIRTLLKLGRHTQAANTYEEIIYALYYNLEAYAEVLALLRPLFPSGWGELPTDLNHRHAGAIATDAANALFDSGNVDAAFETYSATLHAFVAAEAWEWTSPGLLNIADVLGAQHQLARMLSAVKLSLDLATVTSFEARAFAGLLSQFASFSQLGLWDEADEAWKRLDPMGRDWPRGLYQQGEAEHHFAWHQFRRGRLQEQQLTVAADLAVRGNSRLVIRQLHIIRALWSMEQGEWEQAADSFAQSSRMARERGLPHATSEAGLTLAKLKLGRLDPQTARDDADQLATQRDPDHFLLAMLWQEIGDQHKAGKLALAAYREAWADGEPYVYRYELTRARQLLDELDVPIPQLPEYQPDNDPPFPWEAEVRDAIDRIRAEKEAATGNDDATHTPVD